MVGGRSRETMSQSETTNSEDGTKANPWHWTWGKQWKRPKRKCHRKSQRVDRQPQGQDHENLGVDAALTVEHSNGIDPGASSAVQSQAAYVPQDLVAGVPVQPEPRENQWADKEIARHSGNRKDAEEVGRAEDAGTSANGSDVRESKADHVTRDPVAAGGEQRTQSVGATADAPTVLERAERTWRESGDREATRPPRDSPLEQRAEPAALEYSAGEVTLEHPGIEATLEHSGGEATPEHLGGEATLEHPGEEVILEHPGIEATLEHPGREATLEHLGGEATLGHSSGEATLEHPGEEAKLERAYREGILEHPDAGVILEHPGEATLKCSGEGGTLEHQGGGATLEHLGGEATLENLCREATMENLGGEATLEHLGRETALEHRDGEASLEHSGDEATLEHQGRTAILEHSDRRTTTLEHSGETTTLEHSGEAALEHSDGHTNPGQTDADAKSTWAIERILSELGYEGVIPGSTVLSQEAVDDTTTTGKPAESSFSEEPGEDTTRKETPAELTRTQPPGDTAGERAGKDPTEMTASVDAGSTEASVRPYRNQHYLFIETSKSKADVATASLGRNRSPRDPYTRANWRNKLYSLISPQRTTVKLPQISASRIPIATTLRSPTANETGPLLRKILNQSEANSPGSTSKPRELDSKTSAKPQAAVTHVHPFDESTARCNGTMENSVNKNGNHQSRDEPDHHTRGEKKSEKTSPGGATFDCRGPSQLRCRPPWKSFASAVRGTEQRRCHSLGMLKSRRNYIAQTDPIPSGTAKQKSSSEVNKRTHSREKGTNLDKEGRSLDSKEHDALRIRDRPNHASTGSDQLHNATPSTSPNVSKHPSSGPSQNRRREKNELKSPFIKRKTNADAKGDKLKDGIQKNVSKDALLIKVHPGVPQPRRNSPQAETATAPVEKESAVDPLPANQPSISPGGEIPPRTRSDMDQSRSKSASSTARGKPQSARENHGRQPERDSGGKTSTQAQKQPATSRTEAGSSPSVQKTAAKARSRRSRRSNVGERKERSLATRRNDSHVQAKSVQKGADAAQGFSEKKQASLKTVPETQPIPVSHDTSTFSALESQTRKRVESSSAAETAQASVTPVQRRENETPSSHVLENITVVRISIEQPLTVDFLGERRSSHGSESRLPSLATTARGSLEREPSAPAPPSSQEEEPSESPVLAETNCSPETKSETSPHLGVPAIDEGSFNSSCLTSDTATTTDPHASNQGFQMYEDISPATPYSRLPSLASSYHSSDISSTAGWRIECGAHNLDVPGSFYLPLRPPTATTSFCPEDPEGDWTLFNILRGYNVWSSAEDCTESDEGGAYDVWKESTVSGCTASSPGKRDFPQTSGQTIAVHLSPFAAPFPGLQPEAVETLNRPGMTTSVPTRTHPVSNFPFAPPYPPPLTGVGNAYPAPPPSAPPPMMHPNGPYVNPPYVYPSIPGAASPAYVGQYVPVMMGDNGFGHSLMHPPANGLFAYPSQQGMANTGISQFGATPVQPMPGGMYPQNRQHHPVPYVHPPFMYQPSRP